MKRKSRSKKQNSSKSRKRKTKRNVACTKDDLSAGIIKELGKRERKWAIALTSSRCNLLDDSAKHMVCNILGAGGNATDDWKLG